MDAERTIQVDGQALRVEREVVQVARFDGDKVNGDGKEPVAVRILEWTGDETTSTLLAEWDVSMGGPPPKLEDYQ